MFKKRVILLKKGVNMFKNRIDANKKRVEVFENGLTYLKGRRCVRVGPTYSRRQTCFIRGPKCPKKGSTCI